MRTEIKTLFPTEVMFGSFNEELVTPVAQELLSNLDFSSGGDVSDISLLGNEHNLPELKKFFNNYVVEKFNEYTEKLFDHKLNINKCKFKAWSVNGASDYNLGFHNHSGAQLSAVFYFLVEHSNRTGGKIRFHDPRFNANRGMTEPFKFRHDDVEFLPRTGDFVIFPSYLYHSVSPFNGNIRLILPVDMFMDA